MSEFLDALGEETASLYPHGLLTDPVCTQPTPLPVTVEDRPFAQAMDLARYAFEVVANSGVAEPDRDKGLWAWLALFWFRRLCPRSTHGQYLPGERARWIPALDEAFRYYRHLVLGRYLVYATNRDKPARALAFLCQPPQIVGHVYYQLAARQSLITCRAVVEAATLLYYDTAKRRLRRNAQTYGRAGSVFRFANILMQLDRTIDLHSATGPELLALLPAEFGEFLSGNPSNRGE